MHIADAVAAMHVADAVVLDTILKALSNQYERALSRVSSATASATCSEQSSLCCPAETNLLVRLYLHELCDA